jgi:hypothetical protein
MRLLFASLCCATVSCAPAASPSVQPTPILPAAEPAAPPASGGPTATAPAATEAERLLQGKLATALDRVARLRQLQPKNEVSGRLIGRDEVERYLRQRLDEETPPDVIRATEALLYGLGSVPLDFDYRASVIALMTSQLSGFYSPELETFFVSGELSGEEADLTLWHELVHALQDQHYDLDALTEWRPERGDALAAVHGLAEGDATSTMLDALLEPRGSSALELPEGLLRAESVLGSASSSAPPVLVRSLLAPYADGLAFANALRRRGGFAAVDEAWRAPPVSTEQLLHPEKFLAREPPLVVPRPSAPAHAVELVERYRDVMGEQTLRILFEEWLPARTAATAASDWGGDHLTAFSDDRRERWAIAWRLRFDTLAASQRAADAFVRGLGFVEVEHGDASRRDISPQARLTGGQACHARPQRGPLAIVRRGHDLAVTVGPFWRSAPSRPPSALEASCPAALAWALRVVNSR